ncbi:MAG: hypothetical protein H6773_02260 [Pseudomonadales bacterium]|nr:hypothetical protein [Pseudomonadales bacterium]
MNWSEGPVYLERLVFKGRKAPRPVRPLEISQLSFLPVGGAEGRKLIANILLGKNTAPSLENNHNTRYPLVLKEYPKNYDSIQALRSIAAGYRTLRKLGILVPNVVRYWSSNDMLYLVMSDLSEGGKKLIWGHSDGMKQSQLDELKAMKLSESDLVTIHSQLIEIAQRAADGNVLLMPHYFHILKDTTTGSIEIALLDIFNNIHPTKNESSASVFKFNSDCCDYFMIILTWYVGLE